MTPNNSEIIIYRTEDGRAKIDVRMGEQTVWLTQAQMTGCKRIFVIVILPSDASLTGCQHNNIKTYLLFSGENLKTYRTSPQPKVIKGFSICENNLGRQKMP